ncbi:MAG: hypothetical protein RJA38_1447, partial [Bacteroidota bacterium]
LLPEEYAYRLSHAQNQVRHSELLNQEELLFGTRNFRLVQIRILARKLVRVLQIGLYEIDVSPD